VGSLDRDAWLIEAEALAASGRRVLAVARRPAAPAALTETAVADGGFTLLGLVGLLDRKRQLIPALC
jgi:magnesium-transporting ATPase (P-type)